MSETGGAVELGWVEGLGAQECAALRLALQSGRVRPGDSAAVFQSVGLSGALAQGVGRWAGARLALLEGVLLAHERRLAQSARRGRTEVVRTQPLHVGLDGLDTATAVRQVFAQAEREVLVAGFRLTDGVIFEPLRRAAGGALRVRLFVDLDARVDVFGRSQPAQDPARWPARWREEFLRRVWPAGLEAPEMFYAPVTLEGSGPGGASMHAKTVIADRRRWLVGSANFTGRAQTRNFELGVMLEDEKAADKAIRWFEALVLAGDFVPL